jgi:UDP-3-O-[3-hydroxymyristoyl] glucosamine N-acyltransferase
MAGKKRSGLKRDRRAYCICVSLKYVESPKYINYEDISTFFNDTGYFKIYKLSTSINILSNEILVIPSNIRIEYGEDNVNLIFNNYGTIIINFTFLIYAQFNNYGTINNNELLNNTGTINNNGIINNNNSTIYNYGTINNNEIINNTGTINNNEIINNNGTISNNGTINNYDGVIYTYNIINGTINGNIPVNI